jgi:hypothetical protein
MLLYLFRSPASRKMIELETVTPLDTRVKIGFRFVLFIPILVTCSENKDAYLPPVTCMKAGQAWAVKGSQGKLPGERPLTPPNQIWQKHVESHGSVVLGRVPRDIRHLVPSMLQVECPSKCLVLDTTIVLLHKPKE